MKKESLSYTSIDRQSAKEESMATSATVRRKRRKQAHRGNSDSNMLWSEKYRPKKFMDLLGDQVIANDLESSETCLFIDYDLACRS